MTNRQFRKALKVWMETTWKQIGPEVAADLKANDDRVKLFWDNHVAECLSLAKDAAYMPMNTLYQMPPTRMMDRYGSSQEDGQEGLSIHRRDQLIAWVKDVYAKRLPKIYTEFRADVPGLLAFDFIETTIAGTKFKFRKDRLPYHYKKQFRKELTF